MSTADGDGRFPGALWIFVVGFAVYSLLPLLPGTPYVPANPIAPFAAAGPLFLMWRRDKRSYWVTVALALGAVWYPALVMRSWLIVAGPPGLARLLWLFLTPALLICLLFTPRVRRYAGLQEDGQETKDVLGTPSRH